MITGADAAEEGLLACASAVADHRAKRHAAVATSSPAKSTPPASERS